MQNREEIENCDHNAPDYLQRQTNQNKSLLFSQKF